MTDVIHHRPAALARAVLATAVTSAAACGLAVVVGRTAPDLSAPGGRALEAAVALVVAAAGAVALGVVAAGCLLTAVSLLARLAGHSLGRLEAAAGRITPLALRRVIAVGVGVSIVAAVSAPASAADRDLPGPAVPDAPVAVAATTSGLGWQITSPAPTTASPGAPDAADPAGSDAAEAAGNTTQDATGRPGDPADPSGRTDVDAGTGTTPGAVEASPDSPDSSGSPGSPGSASDATVTVRLGDSLWAIAAAHLPAGASQAAIAEAWPQWYAANRDVIGSDPDLIHPGQVLVVPAGVTLAEVSA